MNHSFTPNPDNKAACNSCGFDFISHTAAARCSRCNKMGECGVYDGILSCWSCQDTYLHQLMDKASPSEAAKEVIANARKIDHSISNNGDLFNAHTISHVELRKAYLDNHDIPAEEREYHFQRHLIERFEWLQNHIFKLQDIQAQNEKKQKDSWTEQQAIGKTLREIGQDLREEIRAKLKEHDHNYKPIAVVKPKITGIRNKDKTRTDQLVEALALMHGISKEAALKMVLDKQKEKDKQNAMDKLVTSYIEMNPSLTREQALEQIRKGSKP